MTRYCGSMHAYIIVPGDEWMVHYFINFVICCVCYLASAAYICANVPCIMMLGWVENLMITVDTSDHFFNGLMKI